MKKELLFAFTAFFFMSLTAITGVYAVNEPSKPVTVSRTEKDVTGDGKKDLVIIKGFPYEQGAAYLKEIDLEIFASNSKSYKIKLNGGYDPAIKFKDLNHDRVKDIFISVNTGGSGGLSANYLYTLKDFQLTNLTVPEPLMVSSQFEDNYQASIKIQATGQGFTFNLKDRKADYDRLGLYQNGKLNEPTELMVNPYSSLKPVAVKGEKFGLKGVQRVSGAYNADSIAYIESTWYYEDGRWNLMKTAVYRIGENGENKDK